MPDRLRTLFAGTPEFAVPSLAALANHDAIELVGVMTQPDRPAGRGRKLQSSPVKRYAESLGLAIHQPESLKEPEDISAYQGDLLVVAAYGLILPTKLLQNFTHAINVHASLLPRWRGAAPIQRAIMAGDRDTGISIMRVVKALDAGPVWLTRQCPISDTDNAASLHDKLATLGADALDEAITRIVDGAIDEQPQCEDEVTYAEKIVAQDRTLDWGNAAEELERRIRALAPSPGARSSIWGTDVKILEAEISEHTVHGEPGTVHGDTRDHLLVATGSRALSITSLQPSGGKPMAADAFIRGYRPAQ